MFEHAPVYTVRAFCTASAARTVRVIVGATPHEKGQRCRCTCSRTHKSVCISVYAQICVYLCVRASDPCAHTQAREKLALWRLQRNVSLIVGAMLVCSAAGFAAIDGILFPRVHTLLRRTDDLAQLRSHTVDGATGVQ